MPQHDEKHIKLCGGTIVWDGITNPKTQDNVKKWSLRVVFSLSCPDVTLFKALADKILQESQWRGVLPTGGLMPVGTVEPNTLNPFVLGWSIINFTTIRSPDVYDENGQLLDSMQYGTLLYPGQQVDVLGHCFDYQHKSGGKGISAGLDGLAIITSANAKPQNFGGINTASAFSGGDTTTVPQTAVLTAQSPATVSNPPTQAHDYLPAPPSTDAPSPAPSPGPVVEVKYQTPDGAQYTEAQLIAANWTPEQIQVLPRT